MTKSVLLCGIAVGVISPLLLNGSLEARTYNKRINIITTDYDLLDTTYIDRGRVDRVRVGDKYQVQMRDGKTVTQVVVTGVFDRMSSVKIVDSWLLKDGQAAKFKDRPQVVAFNKAMRRPAPELSIAAKAAKSPAKAAPAAPAAETGLPPGPDATSAPAEVPAVPAAPDAVLPPAPGAPMVDGGLPAAPDSGLPAAPGMNPGLPDAPGIPEAPGAPNAGLPAAPDMGLPPAPGAPDAGAPPAPDMGLPPAPGAPDAGAPPAPDMGLPPVPDAGGTADGVPPPPSF